MNECISVFHNLHVFCTHSALFVFILDTQYATFKFSICGVVEVLARLACYMASIGIYLPTFRDTCLFHLQGSNSLPKRQFLVRRHKFILKCYLYVVDRVAQSV